MRQPGRRAGICHMESLGGRSRDARPRQAAASPAIAKSGKPGFLTDVDAMLDVTAAVQSSGGSVVPIMTVGEMIGGYRFESIPDGISFIKNGKGTVDVYVNHETSRVPFPVAAERLGMDTDQQHKRQPERLRQLAGQQAAPGSEEHGRARGDLLSSRAPRYSSASARTSCRRRSMDSIVRFSSPTKRGSTGSTRGSGLPAFPGDAGARQIGPPWRMTGRARTVPSGAWAGSTTRTPLPSLATASR